MTTFYIKRPGQHSWDAEPVGKPGGDDILGDLAAWPEDWSLHLPHQCGTWEIAYGTLEQTLTEAREFRAGLDEAIRLLEQEQVQNGQEPARYAKARAGAARSLRKAEEEATGAGFGVVAGLARLQAELLERPSPFADVGVKPYDLVLPPPARPWGGPWRRVASSGCYEESWGWVHMKPACRCPR